VLFTEIPFVKVAQAFGTTSWSSADTNPTTQTSGLMSWQRLVHDAKVPALDARGRARLRNLAIQRLHATGAGIPSAP
jgi:hypothetical protein